jgi:hypothetical protein
LVWLRLADPCATRERIIVNDPERDSARSILAAWSGAFSDRGMLVAEVIREASPELKEQLLTVAGEQNDRTNLDARRLGAWCASVEDRVFGDFTLRRDGSIRRAVTWAVSCVSSVSSKTADPNGLTRHRVLPAKRSSLRKCMCVTLF